MLVKTVRIINRRNMLVQIPGFVMATWISADHLEVYYNKHKQEVIIKPLQRRIGTAKKNA